MAKELVINYQNDKKFDRDINEVAEAWDYASAVVVEPSLTKEKFIQRKIKEQLQFISKQSRTTKAIQQVTVED